MRVTWEWGSCAALRDVSDTGTKRSGSMDAPSAGYRETLRRLTINDERFIRDVLARRGPGGSAAELGSPSQELIRLGAVIALDANPAVIDAQVAAVLGSGAKRADVTDALLTVAPCIGSARLVAMAPRIALAMGYDVFESLELPEP